MPIHNTAIIDDRAQIDASCEIGPYCIIGADVVLGPDNRVGAHTIIEGPTTIGAGNTIGAHSSFGAPPQDLSWSGEPTKLVIGDENNFGDYVQLTRGSTKTDHQTTTIGNKNFLMAYSHVGHDCIVGNGVIAANCLQLAGHVTIEDGAVFGGLVAIHQRARVGRLAMVSGGSVTSLDIPPFCKVGGYGCPVYGLNAVGLKRAGIEREKIRELRDAYKLLFRSGTLIDDALQQLERDYAENELAQHWVQFFRETKRGVVRVRAAK